VPKVADSTAIVWETFGKHIFGPRPQRALHSCWQWTVFNIAKSAIFLSGILSTSTSSLDVMPHRTPDNTTEAATTSA
jgi:hypothetical protein